MAANANMIILSLFVFIVAICTQIPAFSTTSNETDFLSLIDVKHRITSDPSHFLNSWNDSLHFCDWHGITCGRKHKRVTVLDVASLDLVGTLSPSIGNLTFLRQIYLHENSFHGAIPPEFGRLFRLQILVLSNNSFQGLIPNLSLCKNVRSVLLNGNKLSGRIPEQLSALPNLLQLALSINNFTGNIPPSLENLIGEGTYGSVYRGVINPGEKSIAIKVLKLQLKGAHKSFIAECEALRNIRHINLAKIITSCSSMDFKGNDFKALILEYAPNGSLEEWLHQNQSNLVNDKKLDLIQRLNIAIDIATALDYLHNHSGNPLVHCDIKPSNILLGDELRGLVSDFGLAKFLPTINAISRDIESTSIGIKGTIGYVAPCIVF